MRINRRETKPPSEEIKITIREHPDGDLCIYAELPNGSENILGYFAADGKLHTYKLGGAFIPFFGKQLEVV